MLRFLLILRWRDVVLAAAVALAMVFPAMAEPALTVIEPLRVRTTDGEPLVFLVYATEGAAASVKVTVMELKDPETKALNPTGSLKVETRENDAGSRWVTVTPAGNEWDRFGDYLATLRIEAEGVKTPLIKPATFTRVKPEIAIVGFKDKNVALTRSWPWREASRDLPLSILNKGKVPAEVSVGVEPVTANGGSMSMVPARKTARPGMTPLRLYIEGIDKTGTLPAKLVVTLPGQAAPEEVPFNLVVSDSWPAPALAIFTGVLLALIANLLANRLKPIQESRYRGLRLRQQMTNLRLTTGEHAAEIGSILNDLADVDLRNQAGLDAEAKSRLDAIESRIAELQKTIDKERQVVDDFAAVRIQIESLGERGSSLKPRVEELQRLVDNRRYQAATARLAELKTAIGALPPAPERHGRPEDEESAPPLPPAIIINTPVKDLRAGKDIAFEVRGAAGKVVWSFDDGSDPETGGAQIAHTFLEAGRYTVSAKVENGPTLTAAINVAPSALQSQLLATRRGLWTNEVLLSLIALVLAVTTGIWLLYADKTFGSAAQYCEAILWGVGIDSSVRGLGNVMKKLTSNG